MRVVTSSLEKRTQIHWWLLIAAPLLLTGCQLGQPNPAASYVGTPQIHQPSSSTASASDPVWGLDGTQSTYGALQGSGSGSGCRSGFS